MDLETKHQRYLAYLNGLICGWFVGLLGGMLTMGLVSNGYGSTGVVVGLLGSLAIIVWLIFQADR
ncbi:MAG: hypothetical protein U5P41_07790 [Gammaproteobacteria bacterium]|nr:hypothetical protein [Gammaproteobacteria bacterium]